MEREERKAQRRQELNRLAREGRERRERKEREKQTVRDEVARKNKPIMAALFILLFFAYVSTCSHLGSLIVGLLGNNLLCWVVCGCVGFGVSVGFALIAMLMQGRKL